MPATYDRPKFYREAALEFRRLYPHSRLADEALAAQVEAAYSLGGSPRHFATPEAMARYVNDLYHGLTEQA